MNRVGEFNWFHVQLMKNAPSGYTPQYFPIVRNSKIPDGAAIAARAGPKSSCCNEYWALIEKPGQKGYWGCPKCKTAKTSWKAPHARLSFEEACLRIKTGDNVALAAMPDDPLQPVDADTEEIYNQFKPTLKTKGRSRIGGHAWYFVAKGETKLPANIPTGKGEARGIWQYILTPGCHTDCTKEELEKKVSEKEITREEMEKALADPQLEYYTVEMELPAQPLIFVELPAIYQKKVEDDRKLIEKQKALPKFEPKTGNGKRSALFELKITDLVSPARLNARFPHPIHDSTTGQNASISGNLLHCWRCMVSLNAIQFLCVKSGYMTCVQAGTGHKQGGGPSQVVGDDGAIFYAWLEAKKIGVIPEDDPVPVNALHYLARKHKVCKENLIPKRGEFDKKKLPRFAYNKVLRILGSDY